MELPAMTPYGTPRNEPYDVGVSGVPAHKLDHLPPCPRDLSPTN